MLYKDWDVILERKRIRITPIQLEDEPAYGRLLLGDLYDRTVSMLGKTSTGIEEILNHTESAETHAIRLNDETFIGWITLQKDPDGNPDIGISLIQKYRNQGIGPEAVALFVNRLNELYGIDRVYARITEHNIQSQKAFEKLGAVLDRREPDYRMKKVVDELPGEQPIHDLYYYHIDLPVHFHPDNYCGDRFDDMIIRKSDR